MRCVARAVALAAVIVVAGCSLFRDSDVQVAKITSIHAPDTVKIGITCSVTVHAFFSFHMTRVFDHVEVTFTDTSMGVRVWSRPSGGGTFQRVVSDSVLTFEVSPLEPGEYRIIAHQPDESTTQKTITVLP